MTGTVRARDIKTRDIRTRDVECVTEARRGAVLMHPLRARILSLAQEPMSATEVARRLGMTRQQINYHVRELWRARFLRRAGTRRKRNMIEQRYIATARSYVLAPAHLRLPDRGVADPGEVQDVFSGARLLALTSKMQADVASAMVGAQKAGKRLATLSLACEVRFETPRQRASFAAALQQAVVDIVARHTAPAGGRRFRLVVGCYPSISSKGR